MTHSDRDRSEPPDAILPTKRCYKCYGKRPHAAHTFDRVPHVYRCPGLDETDALNRFRSTQEATTATPAPLAPSDAAQQRERVYAQAMIAGPRAVMAVADAELAEKDREIAEIAAQRDEFECEKDGAWAEVERLRADIEMGRTNLAHYREQIDAMAGQVARVRALADELADDSPPASLDAAQACCGLCVWFYEQTTIERLDPDQEDE